MAMRLIHVETLKFARFFPADIPRYAILSHRWGTEETTYVEFDRKLSSDVNKAGYQKVKRFADYVKSHLDIRYVWVDSCCINKESSAELSTAINSMFRWYNRAEICYAHLAGVEDPSDRESFLADEWFRRGWTLQELIASPTVVFVSREWQVIGHKGTGRCRTGIETDCGSSLTSILESVSGVPIRVLEDFAQSKNYSVEERLSWADSRMTTLDEDMSYCMAGIFGVTLSVKYGEGRESARQSLLQELQKFSEGHRQEYLSSKPVESGEFEKLVNWLSPADPWTNHRLARQLHEPGTGSWLLSSKQYISWRDDDPGTTNPCLWLCGKAGCGKTILFSSVINDIREHCDRQTTCSAAFAAFYLTFSDVRKQSCDELLRSFVAQLGWAEPGLSHLRRAYGKRTTRALDRDGLLSILRLSTQSFDKVFLLIDALDECPNLVAGDGRGAILRSLDDLTHKTKNIRVFVTSRPVSDVRDFMGAVQASQILANDRKVDSDIKHYVSNQILREPVLRRLSPELKVLVAEHFSQKAQGMFRWAFCQLQLLKTLKSTRPSRVIQALEDLPHTLDATYERMLRNIEEAYRSEAMTLLQWIAYAETPLTLAELLEISLIDVDMNTVNFADRGDPNDILEILTDLIVVETTILIDLWTYDEDNDNCCSVSVALDEFDLHDDPHIRVTTVRLAHYSVKEYLESNRGTENDIKGFCFEKNESQRLFAESCLTYLLSYSGSPKKQLNDEDPRMFPLLRYSARYWMIHAHRKQTGPVTRELQLLCSTDAKRHWLSYHDPFAIMDEERLWQRSRSADHVRPALFYASWAGLSSVVDELLQSGEDANARDANGVSALQVAASSGCTKIVKTLIENGADVNVQGQNLTWPRTEAPTTSYKLAMKFVLNVDLKFRIYFGRLGSPLCEASAIGHQAITKILIDNSADVNIQDQSLGSPLIAATVNGHEAIVKILIESGADVNVQGKHHGLHHSPLTVASVEGYDKIVKMLIEHGANVNAQDGYSRTPLSRAQARGHKTSMKFLLDNGAVR